MTKNENQKSNRVRNLLTLLAVMGPGLIVMGADNDAGGLATYVQAGAQYGTGLIWVLLLLLPITYFIQEMVARLGMATGQGHAKMIYQRFGKMWGTFSLVDLQIINFLTLVTEFAAINLVLQQWGISPLVGIPVAVVLLTLLVCTGDYKKWERIVIGLCLFDLVWFALVFGVKPDWADITRMSAMPQFPGGVTGGLIFLIIAMIGTTIAPWQLFFQQSCVADKQLTIKDLKWARIDTFIGAVFTTSVAIAMLLVGAAAYKHGITFDNPAQMAKDLGPFYGQLVYHSILVMMINAAILGTAAISMSSAWAYGEVRGWDQSLRKTFKEAPKFYSVYILCISLAGALVLIPNAPLQLIIISVQVLAGIMLPSALLILQLLANDKELLGEQFVNRPWNNVINWTIIIALFIMSNVLALQAVFPGIFSK